MQSPEKPSLYDRLGGVYSIATVVDDFIDRVMTDPRLNANPLVEEAHHRVPPAGFKYLVTEMVCWATGGPQKYTGKSMADSHTHLKITSKEWEAFLDDFQQTLDKFAVPATEQAELKSIVKSTCQLSLYLRMDLSRYLRMVSKCNKGGAFAQQTKRFRSPRVVLESVKMGICFTHQAPIGSDRCGARASVQHNGLGFGESNRYPSRSI
jgi:hemoglobin